MKKILNIKFWIIILLSLFSCEDILEENPPSNISLANFYQSEDDAVAGLYGAYNNLYGVLGRTLQLYGEMNADDLTISPLVTDRFEWDEFTYNSDITSALWADCFSGINKANEVIQYTEGIDFNPDSKADIIAEAKGLRGIYYFQLVRAMGGVPLYTTPTAGFDNIYASRATEEEVYGQIISDLESAAQELSDTNLDGRINAHIANAYLARIHLYRGDYQKALESALKVINSGKYDLLPDYAAVFKPENNNNGEAIYQLQYLGGENNSQVPGDFGPRAPSGPYGKSFWANTTVPGTNAPTTDFVNANPDSYRKSVTVSDSYEHIDGVTGTIMMDEVYGDGVFPYYISKFDDRAAELQSGQNFTVIRYADILLIAAESLNEVEPGNADKYTYINKVRERARNGVAADLPDLNNLSQDEFRTAVLDERRFELAFEGQRAWDLKRRGKFLERLTSIGKNVQEFMLLFPIPDNQVKLNTNLSQNPDW